MATLTGYMRSNSFMGAITRAGLPVASGRVALTRTSTIYFDKAGCQPQDENHMVLEARGHLFGAAFGAIRLISSFTHDKYYWSIIRLDF